MADRGNVPDAGKVHSSSDDAEEDDITVDTTDYPFSSYHPFRCNSVSPESEPEDYYCHRQSGLNSRDRPCRVFKYNVTGKGDNVEENSENSEISSESGNEGAGFCGYVEHLGLRVDGGSVVKTKTNNEEDTIFEDVKTGEIASEGHDEEDETTEDNNYFERFLKRSQLFIRNIMRRACDYPQPTPRE